MVYKPQNLKAMFTNNFSSGFNSGFGNSGLIGDSFGSTHGRIGLGGNITNLGGSFTGLNFHNGFLTNQFGSHIGHADSFGRLRDNLGRDLGFGIR